MPLVEEEELRILAKMARIYMTECQRVTSCMESKELNGESASETSRVFTLSLQVSTREYMCMIKVPRPRKESLERNR